MDLSDGSLYCPYIDWGDVGRVKIVVSEADYTIDIKKMASLNHGWVGEPPMSFYHQDSNWILRCKDSNSAGARRRMRVWWKTHQTIE